MLSSCFSSWELDYMYSTVGHMSFRHFSVFLTFSFLHSSVKVLLATCLQLTDFLFCLEYAFKPIYWDFNFWFSSVLEFQFDCLTDPSSPVIPELSFVSLQLPWNQWKLICHLTFYLQPQVSYKSANQSKEKKRCRMFFIWWTPISQLFLFWIKFVVLYLRSLHHTLEPKDFLFL